MLKKTFLAVDIGNTNVKAVWGYYNKQTICILEYDIIKAPENVIKDGKITDVEMMATTLKDIIKKNRIKVNKLIMNISGTGVITREVQLPRSTDEELENILKYDAQQYFPVDLENYVMDFRVLDDAPIGSDNMCRVLLVAVPIKQADEYMKIAERLKLDMEAIDIPANSITKLLFGIGSTKSACSNISAKEEFVVLDIGSDTTGVYIFQNSKLMFNRILLIGSGEIDRYISNSMEIDYLDAQKIKLDRGRVFNEEEEANETIENINLCNYIRPAVDNLILDINRLVEFYVSRSSFGGIKKMYICGGGSQLQGLGKYIGNYFNIPVDYLHKFLNIEYKGKKGMDKFTADFVYMINATGTLIRE
ncbi:type IV pilus assembly protein PilM [Pseudobacteroides cellulosolvens]|uniref:Type IV pilus assembly protein PilM n=1 Tax=Pseudobacteroides cellulosolvens ATCC 35603 = DSM 2933 TaxID=398512 RepID=A0A0L6JLS5_9FIRM|nr:type IV pilus assembly protein PilM [Pseudobacteroides cellulosolvens]KNY26708.1 type IV pilus assembly protein PilM [Pseudobacteroides cellulosolvens ATCC 35603 = DSM 2933]